MPYLRIGEVLLNVKPLSLIPAELATTVWTSPSKALVPVTSACIGWILVCVPLGICLYFCAGIGINTCYRANDLSEIVELNDLRDGNGLNISVA